MSSDDSPQAQTDEEEAPAAKRVSRVEPILLCQGVTLSDSPRVVHYDRLLRCARATEMSEPAWPEPCEFRRLSHECSPSATSQEFDHRAAISTCSDEQCDHIIRLAESRGTWSDGRAYSVPEYCAQFLLPLDRYGQRNKTTTSFCSHRMRMQERRIPDATRNAARHTHRFFDPVVRQLEELVGRITGIAPHNDEDPIKCSRHQPPQDGSVSSVSRSILPAREIAAAAEQAQRCNLPADCIPKRPR